MHVHAVISTTPFGSHARTANLQGEEREILRVRVAFVPGVDAEVHWDRTIHTGRAPVAFVTLAGHSAEAGSVQEGNDFHLITREMNEVEHALKLREAKCRRRVRVVVGWSDWLEGRFTRILDGYG